MSSSITSFICFLLALGKPCLDAWLRINEEPKSRHHHIIFWSSWTCMNLEIIGIFNELMSTSDLDKYVNLPKWRWLKNNKYIRWRPQCIMQFPSSDQYRSCGGKSKVSNGSQMVLFYAPTFETFPAQCHADKSCHTKAVTK